MQECIFSAKQPTGFIKYLKLDKMDSYGMHLLWHHLSFKDLVLMMGEAAAEAASPAHPKDSQWG